MTHASDAAERERLLEQLLAAEGFNDLVSDDVPVPRGSDEPAPLSFSQEVLWLLDRASNGLAAYNAAIARRIRGPVDEVALERALNLLVARHEGLRTIFHGEGESVTQVVLPPAPVHIQRADLRDRPAHEREAAADALLRTMASRPFNLATETQFTPALIRVADEDAILLLLSHHIVTDAVSYRVLFEDLAAIYGALLQGREPVLPPLPVSFADFAAWQRRTMQGEKLEERLRFWRERLSGELPVLELPTDFRRPATQQFEGARAVIALPAQLVEDIKRLARNSGASLYMVLLAAYQSVLHRWSGQDDIVTGSPFAARTHREIEGVVGYFSQALPLRAWFGDDPTFTTLLKRVADAAISTFEHQDIPFEALVLELQRGGQLSHAPLFRCVLTMQDVLAREAPLGNAVMTESEIDVGSSKFDLTLLVNEAGNEMELRLWYRTDLFLPETAARFLGHFRTFLEAAVASPDARVSTLRLMTPAERGELAAWNDTAVPEGAAATLVELFERQAERVPQRTAVVAPRASATAAGSVAGTVTLTYQELNTRANQLAHRLGEMGVTADAPVGLLLDRSAEAIVGLVGILKTGGCYVPLPVAAPEARIAQQLAESGVKVVVTNVGHLAKLPSGVEAIVLDRDDTALAAAPKTNPSRAISPSSVAYVLYTSGSTGVPKGVAVTHANVVHYTRAVQRVLDVPADAQLEGMARQFGLASTLAADLGNTCVYPALLSGATLHVLGAEVTTEPERFAQYMGVHQLDVIKLTPNHLRALTAGRTGAALAEVLPREWVVTGGEALTMEFARTLLGANRPRVLNHYGPTETTVGVLTNEVTSESLNIAETLGAQTVPLGRPLANTLAFVVDAHGNDQPVGIAGELLIGGDGVTLGYLGRPELTAERFIRHGSERVYRTGDRVRRLADGSIEFIGRVDFQVKVRGYRVELGEIEQVLRGQPGVEQCAVILRDVEGSEPVLVAYAVAKQAGYAVSHSDRPTPEKLRDWIAAQLPEYMVPSAVVMLERLPLTTNGKLDRAALPAPDAKADAAASSVVLPRTPTETQLAAIWSEVLKREEIGVTDNFLSLGGHSLLAIRVLGKISKTFGVRLPLRALFETPTVEQLSAAIDSARAGS